MFRQFTRTRLKGMKKGFCLFAFWCLVSVTVPISSSLAWEFGMTGSMNWRYAYITQLGHQGFFGPYNVDNGAGTTTANLNFWFTGGLLPNLVTGADAGVSYFNVVIEPTVKINQAVRLEGKYRVGQWENPQASVLLYPGLAGYRQCYERGAMDDVSGQQRSCRGAPWG